jgi:hypothetical protein
MSKINDCCSVEKMLQIVILNEAQRSEESLTLRKAEILRLRSE